MWLEESVILFIFVKCLNQVDCHATMHIASQFGYNSILGGGVFELNCAATLDILLNCAASIFIVPQFDSDQ